MASGAQQQEKPRLQLEASLPDWCVVDWRQPLVRAAFVLAFMWFSYLPIPTSTTWHDVLQRKSAAENFFESSLADTTNAPLAEGLRSSRGAAVGSWATFDDEAMSGIEMRNAFFVQTEFTKNQGKHEPSLLQPSEHGIAVQTQEGRSSVSHVDHLFGSLSETGTPLEYPITLSTRQGTVTDLARHSFASFRLNQKEYE